VNKERMTYDEYVSTVDERVNLRENEASEIVVFLYQDSWSVKECCDHIKSVRSFNEKIN
jgi:hypothetical protein